MGYLVYGDRLPTELSNAAARAAKKVGSVPGVVADRASTPHRDSVRAAERDITWATLGAATGARTSAIAGLSRRNGPAYVTLGTAELAALLSSALPSHFPRSATNLQLALNDSRLLVRAAIDAAEIAGDGTLGRLLGTALTGRDSLRLAGTLEVLRPGLVQYRIQALRMKGIDVPARLIPTVLGVLRRGARVEGEADDAIVLPMPRDIADLRITQSRLILYKAVPAP